MTVAVVFYYLKLPETRGKLRLTCNLANAAFKKGHKVYVNGADEQQCNFLNEFLWTFTQNSFIPHVQILEQRTTNLEKYPVTIGHIPPPEQFNDVLISLKEDVPEYVTQFQRIMEPIDADSRDIEQAKIRFAKYTSLFGTEPTSHVI